MVSRKGSKKVVSRPHCTNSYQDILNDITSKFRQVYLFTGLFDDNEQKLKLELFDDKETRLKSFDDHLTNMIKILTINDTQSLA